jgi:AcrR family transcriptional regulator
MARGSRREHTADGADRWRVGTVCAETGGVHGAGGPLVTSRLAPADWCDAGLALLRDEGMAALTVDRMCTALGRTKGSFYHHFRDLDAFLTRLLVRWEETYTDAPIAFAGAADALDQRAARLDDAVERLDHRLEVAVRAWALRDPRARAAVARIDARRMAYLTDLHTAVHADRARESARLEYLAFVGAQHVSAMMSPADAAQLVRDMRQSLAQQVSTLATVTARPPRNRRPMR